MTTSLGARTTFAYLLLQQRLHLGLNLGLSLLLLLLLMMLLLLLLLLNVAERGRRGDGEHPRTLTRHVAEPKGLHLDRHLSEKQSCSGRFID